MAIFVGGWAPPRYIFQKKRARSMHQGIMYILLCVFGIVVMIDEYFVKGYSLDICEYHDVIHPDPETGLYNHSGPLLYSGIQIGWYVANFLVLVFTPKKYRSGDHITMLIHHIVTPLLMYLTTVGGYAVTTVWYVFLHDISDVFLHVAKYLREYKKKLASEIVFGIFAIVFGVTRFVMLPQYPWRLFWSTPEECANFSRVFPIIDAIIYILSLWWFYLILKICVKALKGEEVEDSREEKME